VGRGYRLWVLMGFQLLVYRRGPGRTVPAGWGAMRRAMNPRRHSFGPEDIGRLSAAFEAALGKLGLVHHHDRQQWQSPS
jgi:hypothetical protein